MRPDNPPVAGARSILKGEEVRAFERAHADSDPPLMERAGAAAAEVALQLLAARRGSVLVVAGPGNNGGDGYVLARRLKAAGCDVVVVAIDEARELPADAEAARSAWREAGGRTVTDFVGSQWALAVDALFGIGLTRPLEGKHADWVARINALPCPVLSLDVPSGLNADTGAVMGCAVRASHTATFIALKPGLLTGDGPDHCGVLSLHNLDLPSPASMGRRLDVEDFSEYLRPRARNTHKGSYGDAAVIGGAEGMQGAALLASRAALMLGAGRVYAGLLDAQALAVDPVAPEIMLRAAGDLHLLASAMAVGPGLGQSEAAQQQVRRALGFNGALLLDADALNLVSEMPALQSLLAQREGESVLTPHPAEAARLLRCATREVQADRVAAACELAQHYRAEVVLKGCGSVLASPDGRWVINTTGHAGMASAGMGDVLSGITLGLLAQGWPAAQALRAAVHVHGLAAEQLAMRGVGPIGLTASETIPAARAAFNALIAR